MLISILNLIPSGYWTSQTMKCLPSMILLFCCCVFCLRTKWPHSTFPTSAWRRSWFLRLSRSGGRREGSQSTSLSIKEGALYATMAPSMIGKTRQFRQLHVLSFWWIYLQSTGWGDKALSRKLVRIKSRETTVTLLLLMLLLSLLLGNPAPAKTRWVFQVFSNRGGDHLLPALLWKLLVIFSPKISPPIH